MRDALNDFGAIASGANQVSANVLDFDVIDEGAVFKKHHLGDAPEQTVVFQSDAAVTAEITCKLQDSDTETGTYTDLVTAQATAATGPAGTRVFIPFPVTHKRYVRAAASGSNALHAWLEPGCRKEV